MSRAESVDWSALVEWVAATAGISLTPAQVDQLRAYLDTLVLWNRKMALVSQRDATQIIDKHIADSLFAAAHCADGEPVIDLGSGAGFPGLPIAIARPSAEVCLVEARGKKASFLEEACRTASIRNVAVCHARIEALADSAQHRARYAVVTARALTDTVQFLALAQPFLRPGGRAIAMRSTSEDRTGEPANAQEILYQLPDGTPRRLLVM